MRSIVLRQHYLMLLVSPRTVKHRAALARRKAGGLRTEPNTVRMGIDASPLKCALQFVRTPLSSDFPERAPGKMPIEFEMNPASFIEKYIVLRPSKSIRRQVIHQVPTTPIVQACGTVRTIRTSNEIFITGDCVVRLRGQSVLSSDLLVDT